jgi:glycosyltransferase involved in cell wall biosynthesis
MRSRDPLPTVALCTEYPVAQGGGVGVIVEELAAGLRDEFRLLLVSPDPEGAVATASGSSPFSAHLSFQLAALPPSPAYRRQSQELVRRLKVENTAIAHFHCGGTFGWGNRWPGLSIPELCSRQGIRAVWTNHLTALPDRVYAPPGRPAWLGKLLSPLARAGKARQMAAVDWEIAVSDHDLDFFRREYRCDGVRLKRIYHSRLEKQPEPSPGNRLPIVLAVGHLAFRKGQDVLVRAFLRIASRFPEWRLIVAGPDGGGGCLQEIERQIGSHPEGHRIELAGACSHPMELMAKASIFVQPSLEEALGLALQEALFCGCPAIGSRTGGIPEVIEEGRTGLLVPPGDSAALATALASLIENEAMRGEMSRQGQVSIAAKGMVRKGMMDAHRKLYMELLGPRVSNHIKGL